MAFSAGAGEEGPFDLSTRRAAWATVTEKAEVHLYPTSVYLCRANDAILSEATCTPVAVERSPNAPEHLNATAACHTQL